MKTFEYRAQMPNGREARGVIQATDEFAAIQKIRNDYPVVTHIAEVQAKGSTGLNMEIGGPRKINLKSLSIACKQIAITLKAGVPIARCLELIGNQTEDKMLKRIITKTAEDVAEGNGLASSLHRNGPELPPTFIETMRAGEESGNLEHSFDEMSEYYEKAYKNAGKIKSALGYPIFVLIVAVIVLFIVMMFVMPAMGSTFKDLGGELPVMTKIMIGMSDFFVNYWMVMVAVIAVFFVARSLFLLTEKGKEVHAVIQLRNPFFGKIHTLSGAAQFANTMAMLLASGLTVNNAVDITSRTMDNYILRKEVGGIKDQVEQGVPFGECVKRCEHLPATLQDMCTIGEQTGELDSTLDVIGEFYDNETDVATASAIAKIEPTMMVGLAIFAGFIVISIYLPMFTMYNYM